MVAVELQLVKRVQLARGVIAEIRDLKRHTRHDLSNTLCIVRVLHQVCQPAFLRAILQRHLLTKLFLAILVLTRDGDVVKE